MPAFAWKANRKPGPHDDNGASWVRVTPGFFNTLGNPILMGKPITDTGTTQRVAVINEAFAKKFFKGANPIGRHFGSGKLKYAGMYTLIGVAADMRLCNLGSQGPDPADVLRPGNADGKL
jgi:hypothetical protein